MTIWLPTLWIATGICLFAGIHFLRIGYSRDNAWLFPVFGVLCMLVAFYIAMSALLQMPLTLATFARVERLHVAMACLIYPVAVGFLALYSRLRSWRIWVWVSAVSFGLLLIADLSGSHGLLVSNLASAPPLQLPWGEQVPQWTGTGTALAPLYYLATMSVFGWAFWRCWMLWKQAMTRRAVPLTIYLVLQMLAVGHAEYVTVHAQPALNWDAIPFLVLVLLLSRTLTLELRQSAKALHDSNVALREENTQRTQAQARLRYMAYHDPESTLPNRHSLGERLDTILNTHPQRQGALVVIDPERFGVINHALGDRTGDLLIREIGKRLLRMVADEGHVARLHGDEFAVVLLAPRVDDHAVLGQVMEKAERLRKMLAEPLLVGTHSLTVSVRMGLAMFHEADGRSDTLLRQAYAALHVAKSTGHQELTAFTRSMQAKTERRLRLETDLRMAIDNHKLHLLYQPQVDRDGQLTGAEALLRWEHPVYGAVGPMEFIPIAENSGQMHALGRLVLRAAFSTLATLPVPERFRLSVNISPWQLFMPDFPLTVRAAIQEAGVDPHRITLEITETAFIHDMADAAAKIRALDVMGIRVAIDDFGTGFASIASLKAFPVHELKIDQAFIRDMSTTQPDRFVSAMIALGRALDLRVIAEGVELQSQRETLIGMGCDALQGYLISRPIPASKLLHWLHHGEPARQPA